MISLAYFDAVYINIYCLAIQKLKFLTLADDHKLSFSDTEA